MVYASNSVRMALLFLYLGTKMVKRYIMSLFKLNADTSKVLSQELLDHLLKQFPLGSSTIHGEDHWMRVLYNGRMLAKETGANLNVVELFALIHDCQRDNDDYDLEHGRRAAEYVNDIYDEWLDIDEKEKRVTN